MDKYINADKLRQAVLAQSPNIYSDWETAGVLNLINKQPTADVKEVVRGKWIGQSSDDEDFCECSICGHYQEDVSDFCLSCGADMREGVQE